MYTLYACGVIRILMVNSWPWRRGDLEVGWSESQLSFWKVLYTICGGSFLTCGLMHRAVLAADWKPSLRLIFDLQNTMKTVYKTSNVHIPLNKTKTPRLICPFRLTKNIYSHLIIWQNPSNYDNSLSFLQAPHDWSNYGCLCLRCAYSKLIYACMLWMSHYNYDKYLGNKIIKGLNLTRHLKHCCIQNLQIFHWYWYMTILMWSV